MQDVQWNNIRVQRTKPVSTLSYAYFCVSLGFSSIQLQRSPVFAWIGSLRRSLESKAGTTEGVFLL